MQPLKLSEGDTFRIGMLQERLNHLRTQALHAVNEQNAILAKYGIKNREVEVITEPGNYELRMVIDKKVGAPIMIPDPEDCSQNGASCTSTPAQDGLQTCSAVPAGPLE